MVHTLYSNYYEKKKVLEPVYYSNDTPDGNVYNQLIFKPFIATLTMLIRFELVIKYLDQHGKFIENWVVGDLPLKLFCAIESKIKLLRIDTSVYRIREGSLTHNINNLDTINYYQGLTEIETYFIKLYGIQKESYSHFSAVVIKRNFYIGYLGQDRHQVLCNFRLMKNKTLKDYAILLYIHSRIIRIPLDFIIQWWKKRIRKW